MSIPMKIVISDDSESGEYHRLTEAEAATLTGLRDGSLVAVPRKHLDRAATLLSVVTVGQVMDGGDRFIEAAGLNPWAVNEGRARREDRIDPWWLSAAQDRTP